MSKEGSEYEKLENYELEDDTNLIVSRDIIQQLVENSICELCLQETKKDLLRRVLPSVFKVVEESNICLKYKEKLVAVEKRFLNKSQSRQYKSLFKCDYSILDYIKKFNAVHRMQFKGFSPV